MSYVVKSKEMSQLDQEVTKEQSLTKEDKIHAFDLLTWASLAATFMSGWQIIIPFVLFSLNSAQVFLAITSFFFLIVSLIVLYWSNKNYYFLKKEDSEDNPILQTWHIEGTIYVVSFLLIACYATFLIGIVLYEDYSWALLVARGTILDDAKKETSIIILSQCILISADIVILIFYIKYSYHLEFYPKHLPGILGYFLAGFVTMCCMTIGDQNYLKSYIGHSSNFYETISEGIHQQIFWTCIIGILVTFFFIYENRNVQQQQVPKVRFYFLPFLLFVGIGFFLIINSLKFLYYSSSVNRNMTSDCKTTLQTFSMNYINTIGCPSKYDTFQQGGNTYYNQECQAYSTGIVWELDIGKPNNEKKNQISCLDLNCCYLVAQKRSLNYKQFFLFALMTSFIGWIAAGHCMDLALQNPNKIKAGPSIYSVSKYASQIIVSLLAVVIAIFLAIQFQPIVPQTQPTITTFQTNIMKINQKPQFYPLQNILQSVPGCVHPVTLSSTSLDVKFSKDYCDPKIKDNSTLCNNSTQGIFNCLYSQNGVFQVDPGWSSDGCKIVGFNAFDQYILLQGIHGQLTSDQFCYFGGEDCVNKLTIESVYVCQNQGKTAVVTQDYKQIPIDFSYKVASNEIGQGIEEFSFSCDNQQCGEHRILMRKQITSVAVEKRHQVYNANLNSTASSTNYGFIKIQIFDAETYENIPSATVNLYTNVATCIQLDSSVFFTVRTTQSDSKGIASLKNIQLTGNTPYLFQIRADGYLYNCLEATGLVDLLPNQEVVFYVPLVKILQKNEEIKVSLEYQNQKLDLDLGNHNLEINMYVYIGATFNLDSDNDCTVAYYNSQCGGLAYTSSETKKSRGARVLTVTSIGEYNYLFFVRLLPTDSAIKNVVNNPGMTLTSDQEADLQDQNEDMLDANVKVNVYVKGNTYPVQRFIMPVDQTLEFNSSPLQVTWLSFCMDGSIGPKSTQAVNHFWSIGTSTTNYWQKSASNLQTIPDASKICQGLYKSATSQPSTSNQASASNSVSSNHLL